MKERPILFSSPMVQAILAGRKTQTRRVMKPQPSESFLPTVGRYHPSLIDRKSGEMFPGEEQFGASDIYEDYPSKHGQPGDRLWVKETFSNWNRDIGNVVGCDDQIVYRADAVRGIIPGEFINCKDLAESSYLWTPSIFMPRAYSRITLEITGVRVERLNDITPEDARAEGCGTDSVPWRANPALHSNPWVATYAELWESINGAGSWAANPWVWVIEFRRIQP